MSDGIRLLDIFTVEYLQRIQDAFSDMTGIGSVILDEEGNPLTDNAYAGAWCMEHIRSSKEADEACKKCDMAAVQICKEKHGPVTYHCHAGLTDFAAPIYLNDQMVGSIVGGQIIDHEPEEEHFRGIAEKYGIDFDALWASMEEIKMKPKAEIERLADGLYSFSKFLSETAYEKYQAQELNQEIEKSANMKSDFLANMSHEIRTPMNAVIGMAEMALREDLPQAARDYINQIKSSGRALLNIINDILDFSKIESGKMDIVPDEYEPLSLLNDIVNIVMTRLHDKDVELLLDVEPTFPRRLYGDSLRVRQILINLANNAVKFTNHGQVIIKVGAEKIDDDTIMMKVEVKDTGIGIKEEDLQKLFQSFQQVDSKRNRNVEGTGLGLAITQKLLQLMGGQIHVDSVYEQGSSFFFDVPQKVIDWEPCIVAKYASDQVAIGYFKNMYLARMFFRDIKRLGVYSMVLMSPERYDPMLDLYEEQIGAEFRNKRKFLFLEQDSFDEDVEELLKTHSELTGAILIDFDANFRKDIPNLHIMPKPMSSFSIALALNGEELHLTDENSNNFEFDFTAPNAEVLIVDDNAINLTVAEGLLEPLHMKVYTALSGKAALDLIDKQHFDLIFMDHMMPEIDGVETTRIIRRLHPECNDIPIIALTANAVGGTKEMFLSEGMNDFVAKPIEVRTLVSKVKQWLPVEKVIKGSQTYQREETVRTEALLIGDLDTAYAIEMLGNEKLFWNILKEYYKTIQTKADSILAKLEAEDWPGYTIEVHALKSASKQIGAFGLSEQAAALEKAGNARDTVMMRGDTGKMIEKYLTYISILKPYCEEEKLPEGPKEEITAEELKELLREMSEAVENLDMDAMEETSRTISGYSYPLEQVELLEKLREAVETIDVDSCEEIIAQWEEML